MITSETTNLEAVHYPTLDDMEKVLTRPARSYASLTISVRWRSVLSAPRPKVPSTSPITRGPHAKTRGQDGLSSAEPGSR